MDEDNCFEDNNSANKKKRKHKRTTAFWVRLRHEDTQIATRAPTSHTHPYAPLTGAGTSGTWPIDITGKADDSDKLNGLDSSLYVNMTEPQTISGAKSFINIPPSCGLAPTVGNHLANRTYVDSRINTRAVQKATTTDFGGFKYTLTDGVLNIITT